MAVKPDAGMGYRTGAKMLLIFMFAFFFVGYSPLLSISLGAIAGLSSGFISSWWHAKEDFFTEQETTQAERSNSSSSAIPSKPQVRVFRYGFGVKLAKNSRIDRQNRGGISWPFQRKR